jgi:hypothetical protein
MLNPPRDDGLSRRVGQIPAPDVENRYPRAQKGVPRSRSPAAGRRGRSCGSCAEPKTPLQPGQLARFASNRLSYSSKLLRQPALPVLRHGSEYTPFSPGAPDRRLFSGWLYHASPE